MKTTFGYVLPSSTGADVPGVEDLLGISRMADESPLEHLWVSDHLIWWHPMYDSLTLLGALAATTSRIRLGPGVLQIAMRQPIVVAKQLATIQRLSGGRLTVGVGVGGEFPPEWEAAGVSRATRGRRTDEILEALDMLWAGERVTYEGRHVHLADARLQPSATRPPIWIGGRKTSAMNRAARFGDGFMGLFVTPEMYATTRTDLERACDERGRDHSEITKSLYVWTCIADTDEEATRIASSLLSSFYNVPFERLAKYAIVGSESTCAARFEEFRLAGVQDFAVAPIWPEATTAPLERLVALVQRFG